MPRGRSASQCQANFQFIINNSFIPPTVNGGEGGIRTHGKPRHTRSPGVPVRPLQHLSVIKNK